MGAMVLFIQIVATLVLSILMPAAAAVTPTKPTNPSSGKECEFWRTMVSRLNQMQRSESSSNDYVHCWYHPEKCEQLDCNGFFRNPTFAVLNFTYCWGMIVNHCDNPISIDIYLQIHSKNISMTQRVYHNTSVPIPQLSFDRAGTKIGFEMFIELQKNTNNSITIGIRVKTSYSLFGSAPYYPTDLQKQVIPPTTFPVSPCSHTTKTPNITLGSCGVAGSDHHGSTTTPRPVITGLPPIIVKNGSKTYNGSCNVNLLTVQCHSTTEMCKRMSNSKDMCACKPDLYLCPVTGFCSTIDDCQNKRVPAGYVTPARHNQNNAPTEAPSSHPFNSTALIIGSVCGGVVLLVILAVVIVFFMKRRGVQYRGRQLLLTEDDTDGII